jgi:hypothetical protein
MTALIQDTPQFLGFEWGILDIDTSVLEDWLPLLQSKPLSG